MDAAMTCLFSSSADSLRPNRPSFTACSSSLTTGSDSFVVFSEWLQHYLSPTNHLYIAPQCKLRQCSQFGNTSRVNGVIIRAPHRSAYSSLCASGHRRVLEYSLSYSTSTLVTNYSVSAALEYSWLYLCRQSG